MARTQEQLQAELDSIEAKLSMGVTEVTTNGTKTVIDLEALERRARLLRSQIDTMKARRPVASSVYLGGF